MECGTSKHSPWGTDAFISFANLNSARDDGIGFRERPANCKGLATPDYSCTDATHVIHQHDDHVGFLCPCCGAQHKSGQESGENAHLDLFAWQPAVSPHIKCGNLVLDWKLWTVSEFFPRDLVGQVLGLFSMNASSVEGEHRDEVEVTSYKSEMRVIAVCVR